MIKKWKEKQILFFFFKKHLKTHSQTLFSTFLSVLERKNKTKNQSKKKHKKKALFFWRLIFFLFFFDCQNYFFNGWNLCCFFSTVKVIFLMVDVFLGFFFDGRKFEQWKKVKLRLFVSWGGQWHQLTFRVLKPLQQSDSNPQIALTASAAWAHLCVTLHQFKSMTPSCTPILMSQWSFSWNHLTISSEMNTGEISDPSNTAWREWNRERVNQEGIKVNSRIWGEREREIHGEHLKKIGPPGNWTQCVCLEEGQVATRQGFFFFFFFFGDCWDFISSQRRPRDKEGREAKEVKKNQKRKKGEKYKYRKTTNKDYRIYSTLK